MKTKFFYGIALLVACTMLTVSCKKNNSVNQNVEVQAKATAAVLEYSFTISDTLNMVADYTVHYYDNDGKLQSEPLTGKAWSKSFKAKLPAKLGVRVTGSPKADFDASKYDRIVLGTCFETNAYAVDDNNKVIGNPYTKSIKGTAGFSGENFVSYLNTKNVLMTLVTFDADGNLTVNEEWK